MKRSPVHEGCIVMAGLTVIASMPGIAEAQTDAARQSQTPAPAEDHTVVVVTGKTPTVQNRIDRRTYDIKNDPDAQTGVIADVLGKLPSVQVSPSGVISLRGDTHVFIMIDGKFPANGNAAAQTLSASDVDRVEIITNPSAQFAPEGTSGIINIITKKRHPLGFRGTLNARINTLGQSNVAPSFNLTKDRWSLSGRARYGHVPFDSEMFTDRTQPIVAKQYDRYNGPEDTYVATVSGGYKATDHGTFTLQSQFYRKDNKNTDNGYFSSDDLSFQKRSPFSDSVKQSDAEGIYEYQDDDKGLHLTLDADHTRAHEVQRISETDLFPDTTEDSYGTVNTTSGIEDNLKADWEQHFQSGSLLTAGLQWDRHQNTIGRDFIGDSGDADNVPLDSLDHVFGIDQTIASAYATYQWSAGKWTILPGLRLESELRDMSYLSQAFHTSEMRWYPSFHLERSTGDHTKFKFSYSRRVQRPELANYDPGIANINVNGEYVGNPYLKPMDTDSFELAYAYDKKETNYQATFYLHQNSDTLTEVTSAQPDGYLVTSPVNAGDSHAAGIEFTAKAPLSPSWKYEANLDLSDNELNRIGLGNRDYFSYVGNGQIEYDTEDGDQYQANLVLAGRAYTVQGYTKATYRIDLTYQHALTSKLVLVASITDLTKSQSETIVIDTPGLKSVSYRRPYDQSFRIGLSWKFGAAGKH